MSDERQEVASRQKAWLPRALFGLAFGLILLGQLHPFDFGFIAAGLDASWVAATIYARTHGLIFGHDFVFTSGPWSSFYTRGYAGELVLPTLAFMLSVLVFTVASVFALLSRSARNDLFAGLFWLLVLLLGETFSSADAFFFALPFLTATLIVTHRQPTILAIAGVVLTAFASEAKFSEVPLSLGAFLLADLTLVVSKKWPITLICYLIFGAIAFALAGQPLAAFPGYILAGVQTSSGYSSAMSQSGKWLELGVWVALATIVALCSLWQAFSGDARGRSAIRALLVCGLLFVAMKEGFVRHDGHSRAAWMALLFVAMIGGVTYQSALRAWAPLSVAILAAAWLCGAYGIGGSPPPNPSRSLRQVIDQVQTGAAFALHENVELQKLAARDEAARAATRQNQPVPSLAGSVDIIPSQQSSLVAAGLDYTPRPTIQEYSAYSPALIDRDRAFFLSGRAPQNLLIAPGSIDGHYPASAEGALWPLFLERYESQGVVGNNLLLATRQSALPDILGAPNTVSTALDQSVHLPADGDAWFVKIDVAETAWGKLFDFFFKPPLVFLKLRYGDGSERSYRLIPGMVSEGMLLSPTVATANDLDRVFHGEVQNLPRPVAMTISTDPLGSVAYQAPLSVTFQPLDLSKLTGK
jgi:hypothetical protein